MSTPAPTRRWLVVSTPLAVSLVVHGVLVAVLGAVAFNVALPRDVTEGNENEVYLALRSPAVPRTQAAPTPPPPLPASVPPEPALGLEGAGPAPTPPKQDVARPVEPAPAGPVDSGVSDSLKAQAIGVSFAGLKAERARSVVYVVDCSGPMVTTLPQVIGELRRSIDQLEPTQKFTVILFGDEGQNAGTPPFELFEKRLIDATPRAIGRLADWLKQATPRGRSNPLDGLRAALALRPQVVFLLSRSIERSAGNAWGAGPKATLAELEQLNPRDNAGKRQTAIKTIQFLEDDPTGTMQLIAGSHGGGSGRTGPASYRVLKREELR